MHSSTVCVTTAGTVNANVYGLKTNITLQRHSPRQLLLFLWTRSEYRCAIQRCLRLTIHFEHLHQILFFMLIFYFLLTVLTLIVRSTLIGCHNSTIGGCSRNCTLGGKCLIMATNRECGLVSRNFGGQRTSTHACDSIF